MKKDDAQAKLDEAKKLGKFYTPKSVALEAAIKRLHESYIKTCNALELK